MPPKRIQSSASSTSTNNLAAPAPIPSFGLPHQQQQQQQQQQQYHLQPSISPSPKVKQSPSLPSFTRSASPSGLSNFFSRPTKWFTRTSSGSRASPVDHPRVSTSSSSSSKRRPTISGPTDPRPIDSIGSPGVDTKLTGTPGLVGLNDRASRSVLDLSSRASTDLNGMMMSSGSSGTGDLRSIARKGWSRSVDNLQIIPPSKLTPLNTSSSGKQQQQQLMSDMEMKIEQYRTGTPTTPASLASVSVSSTVNQKIYPFPTMPGTPGTPPPSEVSSLHQQQQQQYFNQHNQHQLRHAHSNSGSSSSLIPPSPSARLVPPMASPQRASRKRSFDFDRSKGKSLDAPTSLSSSPSGGGGRSGGGGSVGFPFYFGNSSGSSSGHHHNHHPERKNSTPVTPTPPTIIEPNGSNAEEEEEEEEEEGNSSKRASQIVHRAGFIMRLQNFSPCSPPQLSSNKNWKPFKMVLKGSKLYFHKPPGDRAAAIKELFPSGLVAVVEEEAAKEEGLGSRSGREREEARKRRAFWGRRTHPDLVVEGGKVHHGTLEALVHESVFGTTFFSSPSQSTAIIRTSGEENEDEVENDEDSWKDFASSILFFLPYLVDRANFEHEFVRCASYFVSGAADEQEKESAGKRVEWLVKKYIAYHSAPVDEESWRAFCRDVVPLSNASVSITGPPAAPPSLESSPNLNAFSPRPGDSEKMPSLSSSVSGLRFGVSSTGQTSAPPPSSSPILASPAHSLQSVKSSLNNIGNGVNSGSTSNARMRLWSLLDSAGFTREVLFRLEPDTVARSLLLYQRTILETVVASPHTKSTTSANGNMNAPPAPVGAEALLAESPLTPLVEFFGCDDAPHWLTRVVIMQILGPGQYQNSSSSTSSVGGAGSGSNSNLDLANDDPYAQQQQQNINSHTHIRAEVIARWARVGEMSRLAGDECSWRAIRAALCAKPIARLEKAWRRVDATAMSVVRGWVYAFSSKDTDSSTSLKTGIVEPRISPWGGDGRYRALKLLEKLHEGKSNEWTCEGMYEARRIFDSFSASLESCLTRGRGNVHQREASEDEDALRLLQHWKEVSKRPPPMKIHRVDQFMALSFAAEPKKKGLYAPYYWSRRTYTGPQVLIPLLVPELLPTITLIDRSQLVRTKKLSYESGAVLGDPQTTRPMELMYSVGPDGTIRAGGPRHRGSNAFDLGGMILPVFDGELLLCVVAAPPPETSSRPVSSGGGGTTGEAAVTDSTSPSRQPSIRVKSAAAGLDRKSSRARRASLPALSQRERTKTPAVVVIEPSSTTEPPLHAIVQAGTLDALVHFLIHGLEGVTVSVADDNGEMALRDKKTRAVRVDRAEFARVWWPSFRSFVTPYVFFQLLRKDFLSSSLPRGSDSAEEAAAQTVQSRQAVIRVIADWIHAGGGAQDALDDIELHSAIHSFLAQHDAEKDLSKVVSRSEELSRLYKEYEAERVALFDAFVAQTMRPQFRSIPVRGQTTTTATTSASADDGDTTTATTTATAVVHNFGIRAPKLEEITPSELVDNLDAMASAAFRNVNQEDLYVTVDLLEVQTSDRTGWFLPREPSSGSEEVEIQSLYTFLMEVEPSSLIGEYSGDTLYRLLPPGIRSLLRAYCILRKWAICCLAAQQLGVKMRQARMEMFLRAIEVCRIRGVESQEKGALTDVKNPAQRPCVRSFVEAVLTSAVVSPECRIFSRAWQGVASARGTQVESLLSLLSVRIVEPPVRKERLTVDPAWLLERMLEVITLSDVLDSPMDIETPLSLVNFDKRRQLHNIIANTSNYVSRGSRQRREMDRMDFERLNRIDQEVSDVVFDLRVLRDEAQREAASLGTLQTPSRKSGPRPFQRAIAMQQEKIKRDRYMRERLMKEKRHEQQRLERKEDDLNRAMDMRGGSSQFGAGQKHQRGKRSMSALFSLMRPISTAFTSESGIAPKRSAAELDFTPSHKPALLLSMVDAHVTPFINNERSFTFQIDTEDGGHYLLQALSRNDMNRWMQTISTSIKAHAQRRLTYLGNASPIQVTDHLQQSRPLTVSHDPKAVFGVDLTFLVRREAGSEEVPSDAVPSVLELCLREIEERGLTEQGIYRVAGATSEVTALRESLNNGQRHIDRYTDINAVCGVVKYWFRTLPETVIPETYFEPIIEAARTTDLDERLARIREIVHTFPRAHFSVLKRLAEHMDRVVDYEEQNHMTPDNLAVVICPNLLRAPSNNFGLIMKNMGPMTVLFKALITHMHFIFDETAEEGEEGEGEGEDADEEEEFVGEDDEGKLPADSRSLFVPEFDFGPRFVASPEPDERLQDASSSPDR